MNRKPLRSRLYLACLAGMMTSMAGWQGCTPSVPSAPAGVQMVEPVTIPQFSVLISGNWRSHIEPCGCTDKQRGGIDRRTDTILALAPNPASRLLLDAGPLVNKDDRQSQLKLEVFLRSLKSLDFDAISLTPLELVVWQERLGMTPEESPAIILTNLAEESRETWPVRRQATKILEAAGRKIEVLILAVYDPKLESDPVLQAKVPLTDPLEAVRAALVGWQSDTPAADQLVVVLSPAGDEDLTIKLAGVEGIDLVVGGGYGDEPTRFQSGPAQNPLAMGLGIMGKYLAYLPLPPDHTGPVRSDQLVSVEIDSDFPRDPRIVAYMNTYQLSLRAENLIADENLLPRLPIDSDTGFAGNSSCAFCHKDIFDAWSQFKHAHAMETLMRPGVDREFDPECVACHTVGMRYEGGYKSMEETPDLAGVGCESCHGPGAIHIRESAAAMALREKIPHYRTIFQACEVCHTHENSPAFDPNREKYFHGIKHWKAEERLYWK